MPDRLYDHEFTPGPWVILPPQKTAGWGLCVSADGAGRIVARIPGREKSRRMADARLIAAAPRMLEVLQLTEAWLRNRIGSAATESCLPMIRSAIESATAATPDTEAAR